MTTINIKINKHIITEDYSMINNIDHDMMTTDPKRDDEYRKPPSSYENRPLSSYENKRNHYNSQSVITISTLMKTKKNTH
jgi:hypothetical protein